jgi:plasmid maintenance system antidote protein VapI
MKVNLNLTFLEMQMENEIDDGAVSVDDVVQWFGGKQETVAKTLGVTKAAVSYWVSENKIPANRAIQVEQLTNGTIKAVNLPIIKRG